ncbi:hypothetical protein lerEdw1_007431 [Lerista edwardsae]|nr:hypothetical protein lerEdw1_007432 [Lerista edwardsae]KAJ6650488.1 hypothetical protein lerEdw1_007431 [Lerista edwardsae]
MPSLDVKASTDDNWSPVAIHQMGAKLMPTRRFVLDVDTMKPASQSDVTLQDEKPIYALPGGDVDLTCTIWKKKGVHVTQTQWSKFVDGGLERLAVYNPLYGTTYVSSSKTAHDYSASFKETVHCDPAESSRTSSQAASNAECNQWILQLRNVSLEQAGVYECSFATFPAGIKSSEIRLIIKKDGK